MTLVAGLLEAFFTDRLQHQRAASPNTVAAYRDTFRLLLVFSPHVLRHTTAGSLLQAGPRGDRLVTRFRPDDNLLAFLSGL